MAKPIAVGFATCSPELYPKTYILRKSDQSSSSGSSHPLPHKYYIISSILSPNPNKAMQKPFITVKCLIFMQTKASS